MPDLLTITSKNSFSKDSLVWLCLVIVIQLIFLGCQIAFIVIQFNNKPEPVYFSLKIDEYFDSAGIASYLKMITEHKQIQQVVDKKLILSGRPTAAPRVVQDGVVDGRYAWQVLLPFILKFNNQKTKVDTELTLNILIVRTSEQQASLGVKIVSVQDAKSSE